MNKKIITLLTALSTVICLPNLGLAATKTQTTTKVSKATSSKPVSLLQVYKDALASDPTYKIAEATFLSSKEAVPQALAVLLPQIDFAGSLTYTRLYGEKPGTPNNNSRTRARNYTATLTQDIFNFSNYQALSGAKATASAAASTYTAAGQDLIQRVAENYFNVLETEDILRFAIAKRTALKRQYDQAEQRYKVGLDTITDVYDVQAQYESAVAEAIASENDVISAKEDLRAITGKYYDNLAEVRDDIPLQKPNPTSIDKWVSKAGSNNLTVIADRYSSVAARHNIKQQIGGHLPTLDFTGSYGDTYSKQNDLSDPTRARETKGELDLNIPVFSGGLVHSEVKQAGYDYMNAKSTLEKDYRAAVTKTRQDYHGINAAISQIKADKQAIVSNISALKGARAEFEVGTKTMLDVLTQQENLFNAQSTHAKDLYSYINDTIKLSQDVGQLSVADLKRIDAWLKKK